METRAAATRAGGPLRGRVKPPGDKSISHRALILGLLCVGETEIEGPAWGGGGGGGGRRRLRSPHRRRLCRAWRKGGSGAAKCRWSVRGW